LPAHVQQNVSNHVADLDDTEQVQAWVGRELFSTACEDIASDLFQVEPFIIR